MAMLMILVRKNEIMGDLKVRGWLYGLGWIGTVAMAFCIIGIRATLFIGGN